MTATLTYVDLTQLEPGTKIELTTQNSTYTIEITDETTVNEAGVHNVLFQCHSPDSFLYFGGRGYRATVEGRVILNTGLDIDYYVDAPAAGAYTSAVQSIKIIEP